MEELTVEITSTEYSTLIGVKERLEIIKDFVVSDKRTFAVYDRETCDAIDLILGVSRKEKDGEGNV